MRVIAPGFHKAVESQVPASVIFHINIEHGRGKTEPSRASTRPSDCPHRTGEGPIGKQKGIPWIFTAAARTCEGR